MVNYNRLKKENAKINEKSLVEIYGWQLDLNKIAIDADRTAKIAKYSSLLPSICSFFFKVLFT